MSQLLKRCARGGLALVLAAVAACTGMGSAPGDAPGEAADSRQVVRSQAAAPRDWRKFPDFNALRMDYATRPDFTRNCEANSSRKAVYAAVNAEDWSSGVRLAEEFLQRCPVDIEAHLAMAVALEGAGDAVRATVHEEWYRGLIESILASGDGTSTETAWIVISVSEEYSVMRALEMEPVSQAAMFPYDVLTVSMNGVERQVYFDIRVHLNRLRKILGE